MTYSTKVHPPAGLRGVELLDTPIWNKGTAFGETERADFGLQGLLPPHIESLEQQSIRAYEAFKANTTDLERHIHVRQLQDNNETLFYRLLHPAASLLPNVRTLRDVAYAVAAQATMKDWLQSSVKRKADK